MALEIELKLVLDADEYERLRQELGEPERVLRQRNVYFEDAGDPRLWVRHGFAIRLRETDGRWSLTVKGAGGSEDAWTARPEWERALEGDVAESMLAGSDALLAACLELVDELPEALHRSRLQPRGEMHNERRQHEGVVEKGVLELDRYQLPDGSVHYELEMEWSATGVEREAAERSLRRFFDQVGIRWRPTSVSKRERFERALGAGGA